MASVNSTLCFIAEPNYLLLLSEKGDSIEFTDGTGQERFRRQDLEEAAAACKTHALVLNFLLEKAEVLRSLNVHCAHDNCLNDKDHEGSRIREYRHSCPLDKMTAFVIQQMSPPPEKKPIPCCVIQ